MNMVLIIIYKITKVKGVKERDLVLNNQRKVYCKTKGQKVVNYLTHIIQYILIHR
jgi:hypothetical protein